MYKKILVFIFIAVAAIVMSGCTKYSTTMEINRKDKLVINQKITFDKKDFNFIDNEENYKYILTKLDEYFEKEKDQKYETKGFKAKKLKDTNLEGRIYTKNCTKANFLKIEDLPDGFLIPSDAKDPVTINKTPFGTTYKVNLIYNPRKIKQLNIGFFDNDELEKYGLSEEIVQPLLEKSSADLTIKIPKKASKHNATKVNEKTHEYYWDLGDFKNMDNKNQVEMYVEYSKINFLSIIFLIFIIAMTMNIVSKNKQFQKTDDDETKDAF